MPHCNYHNKCTTSILTIGKVQLGAGGAVVNGKLKKKVAKSKTGKKSQTDLTSKIFNPTLCSVVFAQ